jgi:hypothetical protein
VKAPNTDTIIPLFSLPAAPRRGCRQAQPCPDLAVAFAMEPPSVDLDRNVFNRFGIRAEPSKISSI